MPSVAKVKLATIVVALVKETVSALVIAPVELIASTVGTDTKFVPVIVTAVCVFSITLGLIADIVGLVSPIVTDPPKDTADPFIVIEEFARSTFCTEPSGYVTVAFAKFKVAPDGTVIVSPESPACNAVPD